MVFAIFFKRAITILCLAVVLGCSSRIGPHPVIPADHARSVGEGADPTPEPLATGYRMAYESFWWNCVAVKSRSETARCPSACRGTPAATAGCAHGADQAQQTVEELIARVGAAKAKERLLLSVTTREAQRSIRRYFPSGPRRAAFEIGSGTRISR
jgi:hypothetical protein